MSLTKRETEVFDLVRKGKTNREIAQELGIAEQTVKNMLYRIHVTTGARRYNIIHQGYAVLTSSRQN